MAILALSNVYIPKASAAESYFTAEGGTLNLDEIDPSEPDQRLVDIRLKATREMTIHSMHGYFTPISDEDEELDHYMSWMDYSSGIGGLCYSTSTGEFDWNTADCKDESVGDEGIHVQPGNTLIYVTFEVKDDVDVLKRRMPITLDLAVIDEDAETGKEIRDITMDACVRAGHELSVYKYVTGNGTLDVPSIVIGGTDVEVGIVPEPGNELVYLELDGQEVTDQIQDNIFRVTPGTESLTFYANFLRVYEVLEGDGGEHIIGSEEPLVFKIDNDVTTFCGTGNLIIDGEYHDMRTDCEVDPDNQVTYYNIENENDCPNMKLFLDDIRQFASREGSWVIPILEATGPRSRAQQIHFCYNTHKKDESYDDPDALISDYEAFDKAYVRMEEIMDQKFNYKCDKNLWYGIQKDKNIGYHVNAANCFTLRVEAYLWIFNSGYLDVAKTIADVFNEAFEPEVKKELPPEMVTRRKGHDFGFGDYIN